MNPAETPLPPTAFGYCEKEAAIHFFLLFSRFEFALKETGFLKGHEGERAEANWDCFARRYSSLFETQIQSKIQDSIDYLEKDPPKRQVVKKGQLEFETRSIPSGSILEKSLLNVRQVRNNLFHGGKRLSFKSPLEHRDLSLIEHSTRILQECLALDKAVENVFRE